MWLRMDLPHATEIPDSVKGPICVVFSFLLWESAIIQSIIQSTKQLKTRVNTNRRILQGILAIFFGALPTRLAVFLIPRMHNPYKLYLVVKVTNQAFQRYKIQYQLVLLKGRNNRPEKNVSELFLRGLLTHRVPLTNIFVI